jgi:tRNA-splicing ligase RtcB
MPPRRRGNVVKTRLRRQIETIDLEREHAARQMRDDLPVGQGAIDRGARLELLYDVSHNTCKLETHRVEGKKRRLYVHRKGATRAFGPGHAELPEKLRPFGQPVLIGGSMGTDSYVLAGTAQSETRAWSSACHGAGRAMSRHAALRRWRGRDVVDALAAEGIIVRSPSARSVAEEAPGAYKDVAEVVEAAASGLAPERIVIPRLDDQFDLLDAGRGPRLRESPRRLPAEAVGHPDWHNELAQFSLDLRARLEASADARSRKIVLRRVREALMIKD